MSGGDEFFIGWSPATPTADRRFLLGAAIGLVAGGGALGGALALGGPPIGAGVWDQGVTRTLTGVLSAAPYPLLRTRDLGGGPRTVFLATSGKTAPRIDPNLVGESVSITGTLITRGRNAMMAVGDIEAAPSPLSNFQTPAHLDRGPVMLVGEILDAKCWFGAMRPGYGRTHKACAALCARGGLPLAFCQTGTCGDGMEAPLLLDQNGNAFGRSIWPFVADPVSLQGRLIEVGDILQVRAPMAGIRRL